MDYEATNKKNEKPKSTRANDLLNVKSSSNRIYFYSGVTTKSVLALNEEIRKVRNNMLCQSVVQDTKVAPIYLYINSPGGSVFAGLSAMDTIANCDVSIYTIVDGCAASAATFLSTVGTKRLIKPHSYMLIHQLSAGMWGKYEEFKDEMANLDELMETITKIYLENSKIPKKKLREILKHDLYLNAEKCLKYGLVDEIL